MLKPHELEFLLRAGEIDGDLSDEKATVRTAARLAVRNYIEYLNQKITSARRTSAGSQQKPKLSARSPRRV